MPDAVWFAILLFVIGVILLSIYTRTGKLLRCAVFSAATGAGAMGVIWLLSRFIDIGLALTPFSLVASMVLGIPGVLGMLLLRLI